MKSDDVAVKAALLDVVDLLHGYAEVHKALRMPDPGHLTDAARYLQHLCFSITKCRLDRLSIRVLFSADDLRLEGERCWKLGLIVSELLTNVARHARFEDRHFLTDPKNALVKQYQRLFEMEKTSSSPSPTGRSVPSRASNRAQDRRPRPAVDPREHPARDDVRSAGPRRCRGSRDFP